MDSDDWIDRYALKRLYDYAKTCDADVVEFCHTYLPLFNMAAANGFYTKEEYDYLQKTVSSKINNICENKYFKQTFSGLEIIGKITYLPADENAFDDIKQLFWGLTNRG